MVMAIMAKIIMMVMDNSDNHNEDNGNDNGCNDN